MQILSKYTKSNNFKTVEPILGRSTVFLLCFIVAASIIGPRIIDNGLAPKYGFEVYGGAGKSLLFGVLAFILLVYRRRDFPKLNAWKKSNLLWLVAALISLVIVLKAVDELIRHAHGLGWPTTAHVFIVLAVVFSLFFSFGVANLRIIYRVYRTELILSLSMAAVFFCYLTMVYALWGTLASVVLVSVKGLLVLSGIHTKYVAPYSLVLDKFGISVSEYCSGIDSIALFSALYALIGILDWKRFNHKRYLLIFLPALIVLFGFNILRVFALILGGYFINPQIAFSLFHTYAGMVFFIVYSVIFWGINYRLMLRVHKN